MKMEFFGGLEMRRCRVSVYYERFDRLWQALLLADCYRAGEMSEQVISGILGCSERHARRMLRRKLSSRT
jgi:MarR-like DNA-binding transcriptional regulator SgrR of sgrS sRNA